MSLLRNLPALAKDRRLRVRLVAMAYQSPLETRIAKKTTRAIVDFNLIEDGDRVMVGRALKAMPARLVSDNGEHVVIRPLVYVSEEEARLYAKQCELPIIGCCCPACGDLSLQRQRAKRLIFDLEREHSGVKQSMLKALGNIMPRHLLDLRLNPSGELRDSAALQLEDEGASHTLIHIRH